MFFNRKLWRLLMSVESKLNALLTAVGQIATAQAANQAATLQAIAVITPGGSQAITDAIAQIEGQVTAIQSTLGNETDGTGTATGGTSSGAGLASGTGSGTASGSTAASSGVNAGATSGAGNAPSTGAASGQIS